MNIDIFCQPMRFTLTNSNCRSIEVPLRSSRPPKQSGSLSSIRGVDSAPYLPAQDHQGTPLINSLSGITESTGQEYLENLNAVIENMNTIPRSQQKFHPQPFRFLDLPLELRLRIYGCLLPPKVHTISTQTPYNGYYYSTTTVPENSAQTFYSPEHFIPSNGKLTTYQIITSNPWSPVDTPLSYPEILRACKQVHYEAEPILYADKETVFDFGTHLGALIAFMGDRSKNARACVRNVRIAAETPIMLADLRLQGMVMKGAEDKWLRLCDYVKKELLGLNNLCLTIWTASGSTLWDALREGGDGYEASGVSGSEAETGCREWEWVKSLLEVGALKRARITCWKSRNNARERGGNVVFVSFLQTHVSAP